MAASNLEKDSEAANALFVVIDEYEHLEGIFKVVEEKALENMNYFIFKGERSHYTKFVELFQSILRILIPLRISVDVITRCCAQFDLKPTCRGNGYRSIVYIVEACLNQIVSTSEKIERNRDHLFFRSYQMYSELNSYGQVLTRLLTIVRFAIVLLDNSEMRYLFPKETPRMYNIIEALMDDFNNVDRECFYGRSFGFQYVRSIQNILHVVGIAMSSYGDGYMRHADSLSRAMSSLLHSGKYIIDPELRAKRLTGLTQQVAIKFCKAFWSLTEEYGVQHVPFLVCPAMDVNLEFTIPSDDVTITNVLGADIIIKFPSCNEKHVGLNARLLSFVWREGQIHKVWKRKQSYGPLSPKPKQRSRYLMIHCHGGGFVSQSSKSTEIYLRYWAKELRLPILSIDYSLAPDATFPQALNEVFFAYVWALNNFKKLGTTGEKIVFTGDSAGANLVTAVIFKSIMHNIRLPDCLIVAYPTYRIQYYPSPSRILCLMDPLLPLGILKACIKAYTGDLKTDKTNSKGVDVLNTCSYNPNELHLGKVQCDSHSHNCGQSNSHSESKLNTIRSPICLEDDEYFSDCPVSDFNRSMGVASRKLRRSSSYGNMLKKLHKDIIDIKKEWKTERNLVTEKRKDSSESIGTNGSLFNSLTSHMSTRVCDMTSSVSSKVFDGIISSVRQQIPSNVIDTPTKVFYDIKSGFTNYMHETPSKDSENTRRERGEQVDPVVSTESVKDTFSICKECLYPLENCNCNMNWTGTIIPEYKGLLDKYGSRHRHCTTRSNSITKCFDGENTSNIESSHESITFNQEIILPNSFTSAKPDTNRKHETSSTIETLINDLPLDFRNPLMSPIFASNDLLKKMPPVRIFGCSLGPVFDDSVEFIRKLQNLNKDAELKVLHGIPHGFLNFQAFSTESREACDLMIGCIRKLLNMSLQQNRDVPFNLKAKSEI